MPTLAAAEQKLSQRTGSYLTLAGVSYVPVSPDPPSPVPAFADAIAEGLAACGRRMDDPSTPTDLDVQHLPNSSWFKFLDVAELRLLETAAGALSTKAQSQRWADYSVTRDQISFRSYLDDRRKAVRLKWGYGASAPRAGTIDLNFVRGCRNEF